MYIDSHTHLNDDKLYEQRNNLINAARQQGVEKIINCADTLSSIEVISSLAKEFPATCFSAYGIIPNEIADVDLADLVAKIVADGEGLVAIGEIGLDYHYDDSALNKSLERRYFIDQIEIARRFNLPLIIHSRDADRDTFEVLKKYASDLPITLHCYSGSAQLAREYIEHFASIVFGIGGVLTFKNARRLVEVVEEVGLEHLVLETDAPYLAPVPHRGELNQPAFIPLIASKIAEIKDISIAEVERQTTANMRRIYPIL